MFDINPETHRHHLAELERQMQPSSRPFREAANRTMFFARVRNVPAALVTVLLILGGFAGGTML